MSTKDSKANEPRKFFLTSQRKLDLKSLNKHIFPHNVSVYYTWKKYQQKI